MRFLLVPGNNSLSHIAKALAVEKCLKARGHEVLIAVSANHAQFMYQLGLDHCVLPDIQESDYAALPTMDWFKHPARIVDCIKAEINLLKIYRPDRVLGVFRPTLKASAQVVGIPCDSLVCGCMTIENKEVLGFRSGEPGIEKQEHYLQNFFRFAGRKMSLAMSVFGLDEIDDFRWMLKGERTFLWDFPEFMPLPHRSDLIHVGPVVWDHWPCDPVNLILPVDSNSSLAVITLGTCTSNKAVVRKMTDCLLSMGYHVVLVAGGQREFVPEKVVSSEVSVLKFAPLSKIIQNADIVISHGGQLTVFEALLGKTPIGVIPFQPEQAHNGVCLERMGCGRRLVPPVPFRGNSDVYIDAFLSRKDKDIHTLISSLINDPNISEQLNEAERSIRQYKGAETLTDFLEGNPS